MYYTVRPKRNPLDRKADPKYYCMRKNIGRKSLQDVAHHIEKRTSLTTGDIMNVLESSVDVIAEMVQDGNSVDMWNLGIFRGTFKSRGVDDPDDAGPHLIYDARITFVGSPELKKLMANTHFRPYPDL